MVGANGTRKVFKFSPTRMAKKIPFCRYNNVDLSKRNRRDKKPDAFLTPAYIAASETIENHFL